MNKRIAVFCAGALVVLAALWGGGYALSLTIDTWAGFPTLITSVIFAVLGAVIFLYALIEMNWDE